jgi:hypothetical protein
VESVFLVIFCGGNTKVRIMLTSDGFAAIETVVIIVTIVTLAIIILATLWRYELYKQNNRVSLLRYVLSRVGLIGNDLSTGSSAEAVDMEINWLFKNFKARLRIYLNIYQILIVLPRVLDLTFPPTYTAILTSFSFLNLRLSQALQLSCSSTAYQFDFIDALIIDTTYPIALVLLVLFVQSCHLYISENHLLTPPRR